MEEPFSIKEALTFGWQKTRAHSALLFQTVLLVFAVQVASSVVDTALGNTLQGMLAVFALSVLSVFVGTGFVVIVLRVAKGERAHLGDLLPAWRVSLKYFCTSVVAGLVALLPLLCGLIFALAGLLAALGPEILGSYVELLALGGATPDIFFAVDPVLALYLALIVAATVAGVLYVVLCYSMSRFAVVDGAGILESLAVSTRMTRGSRWRLLGFLIVLGLLNVLGALALMVGLLVSIPVSGVAYAHVYLKLKGR